MALKVMLGEAGKVSLVKPGQVRLGRWRKDSARAAQRVGEARKLKGGRGEEARQGFDGRWSAGDEAERRWDGKAVN